MNTTESVPEEFSLTALCHGGGCGCKLSPAVLADILKNSAFSSLTPHHPLMVGIETADDAAVYKLNEAQALVLTTDFFLPVVDDPTDFGRIAATNAISDVYAMGGTPIMALAIVGMPLGKLPNAVMRQILDGGQSVCHAVGIPIAGGHSIDCAEPFYGLVVAGLVHPKRVKRNCSAQAGDRLILFKPLGVGVYSAALRKKALSANDYQDMINTTTKLNTIGRYLGEQEAVHALTDVTGFGLPGHLLEVCKGSGLSASLQWSKIPFLAKSRAFAEAGFITGASHRNWLSYGEALNFNRHQDINRDDPIACKKAEIDRLLLCDPQTSGGLLASVSPEAVTAIITQARADGFNAVDIGVMEKSIGTPQINIDH